MKDETKQKYFKIYIMYTLAHATEEQIAQQLSVCRRTIAKAIKWVVDSRMDIPNDWALQIAVDGVRYRMQQLTEDMNKERKRDNPCLNAVIGFQRALKENQELLLKLQSLLVEKIDLTVHEDVDIEKLREKLHKALTGNSKENETS